MKRIYLFLSLAIFHCLIANAQSNEPNNEEGSNILIAYFSRTGNTETVANFIQEFTGGDLFEITAAVPYPDSYQACVDRASEEKANNSRPETATKVENMDQYDVVFIGYPIWWWIQPMIIQTFLEEYDFQGKKVIPFCTYISRHDDSFTVLAETYPNINFLEGFATNRASSSRSDVESWIERLELEGGNSTSIIEVINNNNRFVTFSNLQGQVVVQSNESLTDAVLQVYGITGNMLYNGKISNYTVIPLNKSVYVFNVTDKTLGSQITKHVVL
jgi:flavodoxin